MLARQFNEIRREIRAIEREWLNEIWIARDDNGLNRRKASTEEKDKDLQEKTIATHSQTEGADRKISSEGRIQSQRRAWNE